MCSVVRFVPLLVAFFVIAQVSQFVCVKDPLFVGIRRAGGCMLYC